MKKMRKVFALLMVMAMVLGMNMVAFASDDTTAPTPATGKITITPPSNTPDDQSFTYTIYRIFDATVGADGAVAYKLLPGCADTDVPAGFTAERGYVTGAPDSLEDTTEAFKNYAKKVSAGTITTTGPNPGTSGSLTPGYYYVETTSGAAVIVTPGGDIEIEDKNELSEIKKSAGTAYSEAAKKAIAAVGTDQPFTIVVTKKHGATKLVVTDTMTNMTFNADSLTVTPTDAEDYDVTPAADGAGFTVTFDADYIKELADDTEITLNYTGKVTSDALQTNPATNTATLTTDDDTSFEDEVEVYNAKITVSKKKESETGEGLADAGFVLKNAANKYYKLAADGKSITWVDSIADADEHMSASDGTVPAFTGLEEGTYTLEEKTIPAGYNKAADQSVEVKAEDSNNYGTDLALEPIVVNNAGATLPTTGGIGTTMFYSVGSALVIGAVVLLISKRRMNR